VHFRKSNLTFEPTALSQAKKSLCDMIDDYIQDKIELAGKAISEFCVKMINDGDVILVHA
jgi:translation initiation factor 2B subunit (eIF-2B alpha/beta/delta family)